MLNHSGNSSPSAPSLRSQSAEGEDDILSALNTMSFSSPPPDTSSGSLTGESLSSTVGGLSFSNTSNDSKLVRVIRITPEVIKLRCCGFIGARKTSFCLKTKKLCTSHNNGGAHTNSKFSPNSNHYYTFRSSTVDSAWCDFNIYEDNINKFPYQNFNDESSQTLEDWKILFSSMNAEFDSSEVEKAIKFMKNPPSYDSLKTPSKFKQLDLDIIQEEADFMFTEGNNEAEVALLFLSTIEKQEFKDASIPEDLVDHILNLGDTVCKTYSDVQTICSDLLKRAMLTDVSPDLMKISSALTGLRSLIGTNIEGSYPDLWTAISEIKDLLEDLSHKMDLLNGSQKSLTDEVESSKEVINSYGKRWNALGKNWLPLLNTHDTSITKLNSSIKDLNARFGSCTDTDTILNSDPSTMRSGTVTAQANSSLIPSSGRIEELERKILELEEKLNSESSSSPTSPMFLDH